jgi:hypothetical protein
MAQKKIADKNSKDAQKLRFEKNQTSKQKQKRRVEKTGAQSESTTHDISKLSFESFLKRLLRIPVQKATDS